MPSFNKCFYERQLCAQDTCEAFVATVYSEERNHRWLPLKGGTGQIERR